jgi:acyl-CoA synthetase
MSAGGLGTASSPAFSEEDPARFRAAGWWCDSTLSDAVRRNAEQAPDRPAYIDHAKTSVTWREFDRAATRLAETLAGYGVVRRERVAVWHGDCAAIHVLFVAIERCGAVVVGVGARAGTREAVAILRSSQPKALISDESRRGAAAQVADELGLPALLLSPTLHLDVDAEPKALASDAQLGPDDVFLPVIPTPFGSGLWTSHTTPIYLGATAVILDRFTTKATCEAIARHKVSVLCCVSTQLTMLMADPASREHDLSSLRVVYTGGEALPYRPAAEFEELTGAKILQFFGSNETGMLSATTVDDSRERRLRTGGRIIPEMSVRLFDGDRDVTATGRGQPACRGPATSLGYLGGTDHDTLFTRDGWMRMGDICEIDQDGYLRVTGRTSDFIVRGGKNISASQVEDAVTTHPAIAVAAAVAMPDPVFGEKVCLYAELTDSATIDLPELVEHLLGLGVSKELLPERLIVLDELPRSSGGKVAKGRLREDIGARMEAGHERS